MNQIETNDERIPDLPELKREIIQSLVHVKSTPDFTGRDCMIEQLEDFLYRVNQALK